MYHLIRSYYEIGEYRIDKRRFPNAQTIFRVTSVAIESSLSISPQSQQSFFASRNTYDLVIIYDRDSTAIPTSPPHLATSSEAQRALWNLTSAIYEQEFSKSLKRQPRLLRGGFESWRIKIGEKGMIRDGTIDQGFGHRGMNGNGYAGDQISADEFGRIEARKSANRKASIGPSSIIGQPVIRTSIDDVSLSFD